MPGMWADTIHGEIYTVTLPPLDQPYPYMSSALSGRENVIVSFIDYLEGSKGPDTRQCRILLDAMHVSLKRHTKPDFWVAPNRETTINRLLPEIQSYINDRLQKTIKTCPWAQLSFEGNGE